MQFYIAICRHCALQAMIVTGHCEINQKKRYWKYQIKIYYVHFRPLYRPCLPSYYATLQIKDTAQVMILPFDYIGYKRLSENKRFPNHRWYSDATCGVKWVTDLHCQIIFRCASIHGRAGFILFTIIKTILSTFFLLFLNFTKIL